MIQYFRYKNLILINKTPTPYNNIATLIINDSIGKVLSSCIKQKIITTKNHLYNEFSSDYFFTYFS